MTKEERRKRLIEKIVNKLDSRYVTMDMLERIYNIVNNA